MSVDVSVVTPTAGRLPFLRAAVGSAFGQEGVRVEVVVVDDGSSDGTAEWVAGQRDPRLRYVRHATPQGVSAARNSGVQAARGRWLAFLDDDDVWAPSKLRRQLMAADDAGALWVYTGDVHVDQQLRPLGGGPPMPPAEAMACLSSYNTLPSGASNVVVRADVLSRAGPFDTSLHCTEDWDMWLRLREIGAPAWVRQPLVAYRHHPRNLHADPSPMVEEPRTLGARYGIVVDRAAMLRRAAWACLLSGRRRDAARYYLRAAALGDLRSLGRAAVAVTHPAVGSDGVYRMIAWTAEARQWTASAEGWLSALRPVGVAPSSPGSATGAHPSDGR